MDPPPDHYPVADADPSSTSLSALDWIGVVLVVVVAVGLGLTPLTITPSYRQMFAEFGASAALPGITVLALSAWFAPLAALLPLALVAAGCSMVSAPSALRRSLIVAAFVFSLAAWIAYGWGLYAPIVELSGAVAPP